MRHQHSPRTRAPREREHHAIQKHNMSPTSTVSTCDGSCVGDSTLHLPHCRSGGLRSSIGSVRSAWRVGIATRTARVERGRADRLIDFRALHIASERLGITMPAAFDRATKCHGCGEIEFTTRIVIGIFWRDLCATCGQTTADAIKLTTPHFS